MKSEIFIENYFKEYRSFLDSSISVNLIKLKDEIIKLNSNGGKLIFAGNGASSSIASHCSLDYSKQANITSVCFSDSAYITALSNDCGYDEWLKVALSHHLKSKDMLILISSSGNSENIIRAAHFANDCKVTVAAFSGMKANNRLRSLCDFDFWVDSMSYNIVENIHSIWLTIICDLIIGSKEYAVE